MLTDRAISEIVDRVDTKGFADAFVKIALSAGAGYLIFKIADKVENAKEINMNLNFIKGFNFSMKE